MKNNNCTERFELKISAEDKERLRRLAEEYEITMADYIANCINQRPILNGNYYHYPEDAKRAEEAFTELKKVLCKIMKTF